MMNTQTLPIHLNPKARIEMPLPKGWKRRWADIVRQVCREHLVSVDDLLSPCREVRLLKAREDLYWYAVRDTPLSLKQIGMRVGGRDHSTVIMALGHAKARRGEPK